MATPARIVVLVLGAGGLLAACGNTGRVVGGAVSGVATVGSAALGAVGSVGSAAMSAAGFVAGAGVQAAGAAGSALSGAAGAAAGGTPAGGGASASAGEAVGTTAAPAVAAAGDLTAAPAAGAAAVDGLASGGGGMPAEAVAAAGAFGASVIGLEILQRAGRDGSYRAGELLATSRQPADRCALQVFLGVAGELGFAESARFAAWFGDRVREDGAAGSFSGLLLLADGVAREVGSAAQQAQLSAARLLGFEDETSLHQALSVANDVRVRCPAGAAGQVARLLDREQRGAEPAI